MIIFNNFLSNKLYNILDKKIKTCNINVLEDLFDKSYETRSTDTIECIPFRVHKSNLIQYKYFFIEKNILEEFRKEIRNKIDGYQYKQIQFQFCIWENKSSLKMHYDTIYKYGGTLYLNDWNHEWGGLFEYKNGNQLKTICPQKNLFVFNDINEEHQVTMINKDSPEKRKSIQVWMLD